jgi:hypothetical protein
MRETEIAMQIRERERSIVEWRKMHVKETKTGVKDSVRCARFVLDCGGCHPCGRCWPRSSTFGFM